MYNFIPMFLTSLLSPITSLASKEFIFQPMNFINNLMYLVIGLIGIFIVIGLIVIATIILNKLPEGKKKDNDKQ